MIIDELRTLFASQHPSHSQQSPDEKAIADTINENRFTPHAVVLALLATALSGCTGEIGDPYVQGYSSHPDGTGGNGGNGGKGGESGGNGGGSTTGEGGDITGSGGSTMEGCPSTHLFPLSNAWNMPVLGLPPHPQSDQWINYVGEDTMHPDFGYREYWPDPPALGFGMPVTIIAGGTNVPVTITPWANEGQDANPQWPIPLDAAQEAPVDSHVLVRDDKNCNLYELLNATLVLDDQGTSTGWTASAAIAFDLKSNDPLPAGWTSSDAAGLSVTAGLVNCDDLDKGEISHALRVTIAETGDDYTLPASHCAPTAPVAERDIAPPMGARLAMKEGYYQMLMADPTLKPQAKIIIKALYEYGLIVADNGSNWYVSGQRYDNPLEDCYDTEALDQMKGILVGPGFQFVDTGMETIKDACYPGYSK